ncbi:MAG: hypothetical protein JXN60_03080 [Lentisphaerae bacterium]|nr:hypothetical protein [Lentisphaerota bacterium]
MDLPPKSLAKIAKQHLEAHAPSAVDQSLFRDIQIGKGSLPVLEAFQEFLDNERKRMRNRLLCLAGFFLLLFIAMSAISLLVGKALVDKARSDFSDFQADVKEIEQKTIGLNVETKKLISQLEKESQELRVNVDVSRTDLNNQLEKYNSQIELLDKMINDLKNENETLRKELETTESQIPEISENVRVAMEKIESIRAKSVQQPKRIEPEKNTTTATTTVKPSMMLSIVPMGHENAVSWRLPLP